MEGGPGSAPPRRSPSPGPPIVPWSRAARRVLRSPPPHHPQVRNSPMSEVVVVIGAGSIGQAIARRVSTGKDVVLADLHEANADAAAEVMLDAGFDVTTAIDVSSRDSVHALAGTAGRARRYHRRHPRRGRITQPGRTRDHPRSRPVRNCAGLEEFGTVIARGGAGWSSRRSPDTVWAPSPRTRTARWRAPQLTSCWSSPCSSPTR